MPRRRRHHREDDADRLNAADRRGAVPQFEHSLGELLPALAGRAIVAVRYGVLPVNEEPSPDDFHTWVHESSGAHLLDLGVELTLDDRRVLHAAWIGPPCYYLGLAEGPLLHGGEPLPLSDVSGMKPWPELLGRMITHVTITRGPHPAELDGVRRPTTVPLDAEVHLNNGRSFFLSARRYDPHAGDERAEPYTDTILVTFGRAAAQSLGVGPFAAESG